MALSDITLEQAWDRVRDDLNLPANSRARLTRIADANEACRMIVGLFYDLMAPMYERSVTLVTSTVGAKFVSGGSWVASTSRLTATMNRNFAASDVNCAISFSIGADIYHGYVEAFVSTTVVQVSGDNLPSSNGTVDNVLLAKTAITGSVANLDSLDMARAGQYIRFKLFSSLTTSTSAVRSRYATIEEIKTFRASANQNKNLILFALSGNALYLVGGSTIASNLGTLTLFYPGLPIDLVDNDSEFDIPKGTPYELVIMQWEKVLRRRLGLPEPDFTKEIQTHIQNMYNTFNQELSAELKADKAAKLK